MQISAMFIGKYSDVSDVPFLKRDLSSRFARNFSRSRYAPATIDCLRARKLIPFHKTRMYFLCILHICLRSAKWIRMKFLNRSSKVT